VSPSTTGLPSSSTSTDCNDVSEALTLYESKW
jgi:hypothetical protein